MGKLLEKRRQLAKSARQGNLAQPRTRTMKIQNRRKAGRSEDAYLCSWNNFIFFISGFLLDGAVLLAPVSLISYCPFQGVDGFLMGCWTYIMWWISSMHTLVDFLNGFTKLLVTDYMVPLCWLKMEWCSILLNSLSQSQYAWDGGLCYVLSMTKSCANDTSWWGMFLYMRFLMSLAFNLEAYSLSLAARQTKPPPPYRPLNSLIHGSSKHNI
jgi:hypothetical protein